MVAVYHALDKMTSKTLGIPISRLLPGKNNQKQTSCKERGYFPTKFSIHSLDIFSLWV